VVMLKELSDHLTSVRMRVLEWLVVLVALAALYGAIQQIKDTTAEDPFLFLRLFTTSRDPLPSFVSFLSFLVPLMAIGLGFDAVNSEHNRRTLSRILSQPIYRDALLFGKFLAGLVTLSISLITLWLLVIGIGLFLIGIPPGLEEIARGFVFLLVTIVYAGVWLALALLFSILFRSAATAALVTLGLWLLVTFIWPVLSGALAQIIVPPDPRYTALGLQTPGTAQLEQILARFSPSTLYAEIVVALSLAFLVTGALWWLYFGEVAENARHDIVESEDPGRLARDAYTYLHLPIVAGIIMVAIADDLLINDPSHPQSTAGVVMAVSGPAVFLIGEAMVRLRMIGSVSPKRVACVGALAVLGIAGGALPALALTGAVAAILVALGAWEYEPLRRRCWQMFARTRA